MGKSVVVVGAGVVGLTCATVLNERGYSVTILARDLPEDTYSQAFASPWAGANFLPMNNEPRNIKWESATYKQMIALKSLGISMPLPTKRYANSEDDFYGDWAKDVLPNYRRLTADEVPGGKLGVQFETFSVNAGQYISHLARKLRAQGVQIKRKALKSIYEAYEPGVDIVVNCTGLGSKSLVGVQDQAVQPIRGQTVLVWAPHVKDCMLDTTVPGESAYIIPRPTGDVILGGCFQVDNWDLSVDFDLAKKIKERCYKLNPALSHNQGPERIQVISHNVGLRPARSTGPRLEAETINIPQEFERSGRRDVTLVHAYGIGPAGFQASYGMAYDVATLVDDAKTAAIGVAAKL